MKPVKPLFVGLLSLIFLNSLSSQSLANSLPQERAFKGESSLIKDTYNTMAFLIKKDPDHAETYYAVLAEYKRLPGTGFDAGDLIPATKREKLAITRWTSRLYAYRLELNKDDNSSDLIYTATQLSVAADGSIIDMPNSKKSTLVLAEKDSLNGAVFTRYESDKEQAAETIQLGKELVSTWDAYTPGKYYSSKNRWGLDYLRNKLLPEPFSKKIDTELTEKGLVKFNQAEFAGEYTISEKLPGLFTFVPAKEDNRGDDYVTSKIGVFVDIMNWKDWGLKTVELLLIDPSNASNVGFYYQQ